MSDSAVVRYQITDGTAHLDEEKWLAGISGTADLVQIRERSLSTRDLARLVRKVMVDARVLVNDRADVALACGAAGVHLRSCSVMPWSIRRIAPPGFLISVSCHSEDDVRNATGADYVLLAPVFQPLSKLDHREPLGLDALTRMASLSSVPVLALGGITESNIGLCVRAGAAGVAGISLFRRDRKA